MSKANENKTIDIWLPMFKQGDDLSFHLEKNPSPAEAFDAHAEQMDAVAEHLRAVAKAIRETECNSFEVVNVCADTHHIDLTGPDTLTNKLLTEELGQENKWDEDEECDCDCEDCDYEDEDEPDED